MLKTIKKQDVNMLSGSIVKGILTIAIPIMIMNVVQSLFNVVDMTVLKTFGTDELAVGSVGACGTLISLITGLLIGLSSGSNVVIAKHIGRGDNEGVERAIGTAILVSVIGGVLVSIIGIAGARLFLGWMNCPENLIERSVTYFRIYFAGVPILMVYNFVASILRSSGDSRRPMIFLTAGGVLKVILNYVFVAHCGMSVEGVGIASICSWSLSLVLGFTALVRNQGVVHFNPKKLRFYRAELLEILYIGIPAGLQQALYSIANVIITATVNSFGDLATTGISIANNFDGILYQIAIAPSLAVMPYVSQNVGAGNIKRARAAVVRGIMVTVILAGSLGALSAIFSDQLSSIMSSNPEVIAYSRQKMIIISSTYFICGINEIMGAAMRGLQMPIIPTIGTLVFMCLFRFVWVFLIFPLCPNLTFLYLVWPIGWIAAILFNLAFYIPTVIRVRKKLEAERAAESARIEA